MTDTNNNDMCSAHICPHTFSFVLDNWLRRTFQNPTRLVKEYINEGDTVIDLGCGPGFFSIPMARLVGPTGKVIAVDIQAGMLEHVKRKAAAKKVDDRMTFHQCGADKIGLELNGKADFILAFYMVHETPDPGKFLEEVRPMLKKGGKFLVAEPRMHVKRETFEAMLKLAEKAGFHIEGYPKKKGGRSVVLGV